MRKLSIIICLVMLCVMVLPGYAADDEALSAFLVEMRREMGTQRAEMVAESPEIIIFIFALRDAMRKFKYNKLTNVKEATTIRKIETEPSKWDQEPIERLREAIAIYESIGSM